VLIVTQINSNKYCTNNNISRGHFALFVKAYDLLQQRTSRCHSYTDKMWRARLFSRWPCCVERSTGGHACCFWLCAF